MTDTPNTPDTFDASKVADAILAIDGPTVANVAAVLPTGPTKRAVGQRNAVLAAIATAAATNPAALVVLAILADAVAAAASVTPAKASAPAVVADPADVLAAFATAVTFYAVTTGADAGRGPLAAFVKAAAAVPNKADAGPILASVIGRGRKGNASGGSQSTGTRADRSEGRDASRLAADVFQYRGCTAKVAIDGADMKVTVKRDKATIGTYASLSAAARAAAESDGAVKPSCDGWGASWRTKDGRTADAVARGVLAAQ